jgi:hypothetical protein
MLGHAEPELEELSEQQLKPNTSLTLSSVKESSDTSNHYP